MKRTIIVAALAACLGTAAVAQTNVYRWVDKDGKVQFSDQPPPKDAKGVTQKSMGGGGNDLSQLPYATQVAIRKFPVTMFMSGDCGEPCSQGAALLGQRGVPYTVRNAQANKADAEALKKAAGQMQVPVLLVGDNVLRGYSEDSWNAALDAAGYPRTRLPGQPVPQPQQSAEAPKPDTKQ